MGLNVRMKVGEAKITLLELNTWYPARLDDVVEDMMSFNNKPSPKYKFLFSIVDPPELLGHVVDGIVNQPVDGELNDRHTMFKWITSIRGGVPLSVGDEFNFPTDYIGKFVQVKMENKEKKYEGKQPMTFQNVKELAVCPPVEAERFANLLPPLVTGGATQGSDQSGTTGTAPPVPPPDPQPAQTQAQVSQPTPPAATSGGTITIDGEKIECPF